MTNATESQNGLEPTEPSKPGKSREEIYLELAKLSQQSFQNRQSYEWKIAFGLWTGIGLLTYFATVTAVAVSGWALLALGIGYLILASVWAVLWQPRIHGAHAKDKKWKHYYMHRAEGRLPDRSQEDPWQDESSISGWRQLKEDGRRLWNHPGLWDQSAITLVLLVVSFVIIQASQNRASSPENRENRDAISVSGDNATKVLDKLIK